MAEKPAEVSTQKEGGEAKIYYANNVTEADIARAQATGQPVQGTAHKTNGTLNAAEVATNVTASDSNASEEQSKDKKQKTAKVCIGWDENKQPIVEEWPVMREARGYITPDQYGRNQIVEYTNGPNVPDKEPYKGAPTILTQLAVNPKDSSQQVWVMASHDRCLKPWSAYTAYEYDKKGMIKSLTFYTKDTLDAVKKQKGVYGTDFVIGQDPKTRETKIYENIQIVTKGNKKVFRDKTNGREFTAEEALKMGLITEENYKKMKEFDDNGRKTTSYDLEYNGVLKGAQAWFNKGGWVGTYIGRVLLFIPKFFGNLLTGNWCAAFSKETLYDLSCCASAVLAALGIRSIIRNQRKKNRGQSQQTGQDGPERTDSPENTTRPPENTTCPPENTTRPPENTTCPPEPSLSDGPVRVYSSATYNSSNMGDQMNPTGDGNTLSSAASSTYNNSLGGQNPEHAANVYDALLALRDQQH